MARERSKDAEREAEKRASAVQALLAGTVTRASLARKLKVSRSTLDEWVREFLEAGKVAVTPTEVEAKQRWKRGGRGRKPKQGRTLLAQVTFRCTKTMKADLARRARKLSKERNEPLRVPDMVREILAEALEQGS